MTVAFELPEVGEPEWLDSDREGIYIDGFHYRASSVEGSIKYSSQDLARRVKAWTFVTDEREKSRLDCAGERARIAFLSGLPDLTWDRLPVKTREAWVSAAKAVLDGEH